MLKKELLITPSPFFNQFILKSWWVILFFLICFFIYDQGTTRQLTQKESLQLKLTQLEQQKEEALALHEELQLQIQSQEDPEYIEMILMRKLGLVHEGQTKVLFQ